MKRVRMKGGNEREAGEHEGTIKKQKNKNGRGRGKKKEKEEQKEKAFRRGGERSVNGKKGRGERKEEEQQEYIVRKRREGIEDEKLEK